MKKYCFLIIAFLPLFYQPVDAQKIINVKGSAQVRMEKNMTLEQAREKAKQLAMINAIENAFGTYAEQQFDMTIENGKTQYNTIGTTKVKGDWIETTSVTFTDNFETVNGKYGKEQIRWITCKIKGKARKTVPKANIQFNVLNLPDPAARTTTFYDGEQLYLYFKSPVDGYVAVYLDDGSNAYCLLPDTYTPSKYASGIRVKGDKDYLFFAPQKNELDQQEVEEYIMLTNKRIEYNYLYVVFSEERFVKPMLQGKTKENDIILPRSINSKKFKKWLASQRAASTSFQDKIVKIDIIQQK